MAYLELDKVSYSYPNGYQALREVSLSCELGEAVAIIGRNGAGKTTMVKLMNGLLKPTHGRVMVDGTATNTAAMATRCRCPPESSSGLASAMSPR